MDRFIGIAMSIVELQSKDLKSNMDRFIACAFIRSTLTKNYLKSNMDRFIVNSLALFKKQ